MLSKIQLFSSNPKAIFIINADVCGDLPVLEMAHDLENKPEAKCIILTTEATRDQSVNFGCVSESISKIKVDYRWLLIVKERCCTM